MNITTTCNYIINTIKSFVRKETVRNIFKEIHKVIKKYYLIAYKIANFSTENENETQSIDESLFTLLKEGLQVWILGIINNRTKNFILQTTTRRVAENLKSFVKEYIKKGNIIVHDGQASYNFIENSNDYIGIIHNHGGKIWVMESPPPLIQKVYGIQ